MADLSKKAPNNSKGNVTTLLRCGMICNNDFTVNLLLCPKVKEYNTGQQLTMLPTKYSVILVNGICATLYNCKYLLLTCLTWKYYSSRRAQQCHSDFLGHQPQPQCLNPASYQRITLLSLYIVATGVHTGKRYW